jgi:hypothetical protein
MEKIERGYTDRNIYILSNSQAAIKALDRYQINSKLVWDCHQCLVKLAEHNRIQPVWVPGLMGFDRNERAHQSARQYSSCGIPAKVARGVIWDWMNLRSIGSPYMHKGRLRAFLQNPLQTKLGNCSI